DVEVEGAAAELNIKPITGAVLAGVMRSWSDTVNMVNAPYLAKERGIAIREIRNEGESDYHTLVAVTVGTDHGPKRVEGTLFGNRAPRLVNIFGVPIEAELTGQMIYIVNTDAPGFIGALGSKLGANRINIATLCPGGLHLGSGVAGIRLDRVARVRGRGFDVLGRILVVGFDILSCLLGRALVARCERDDAECNRQKCGGFHMKSPVLRSFNPRRARPEMQYARRLRSVPLREQIAWLDAPPLHP